MPAATDEPRNVPMRLQKFLARAGAASRRGSEDLMSAGRVTVNGVVVTELGARVDPEADVVEVDGVPVLVAGAPVTLALHKPAGIMTTMSDPQGRTTVADLVPLADHPGLFPVGRLDFATTGLLLFSTDGELGHRLLHPRRKVPKTYLALVDGAPDVCDLRALRSGIELDDGVTAPAEVRTVERAAGRATIEITITEGRKRQVRRMFSAVGHPVVELHRTSVGPIELGTLNEGSWRYLGPDELDALRRAVGMAEEGSD